MRPLELLWLALAGLGAGIAGSVAGLASLVSYPALLAVGLAPVAASMTNTVALVGSGVGAVWGSRPELEGRRSELGRLALAAVAGGACGAALLFATPAHAFALVVPWLVGAGSLAILLRRRASPHPGGQHVSRGPNTLAAAVFAVAVYGGYFGAAAGVILLAILLRVSAESLPRSNAAKNLLLGSANAVAAVAFAVVGNVHWLDAAPLAAGFLAGGRLGPAIVRRAPASALRVVIACGGIGLAVHLGLSAYR